MSPIWRNKSYTRQISWKIYSVSTCLNRPIIYNSLIYSESAYMSDAQSVTGAVGLSQFTNIGILEVNDQLGIRGMEYAQKIHTNIFKLSLEIVSAIKMGFSHMKCLDI